VAGSLRIITNRFHVASLNVRSAHVDIWVQERTVGDCRDYASEHRAAGVNCLRRVLTQTRIPEQRFQ